MHLFRGDILPQVLERYIKHPPFYTYSSLTLVHLSTLTFPFFILFTIPNVYVHMLHIADFVCSTRFSHCRRKSSQQCNCFSILIYLFVVCSDLISLNMMLPHVCSLINTHAYRLSFLLPYLTIVNKIP